MTLINMLIILICKLGTTRQPGTFWAIQLDTCFNRAAILQYDD